VGHYCEFVIASELMKSRSLAPDGAMHASQEDFSWHLNADRALRLKRRVGCYEFVA